jgi:hypothetical protein
MVGTGASGLGEGSNGEANKRLEEAAEQGSVARREVARCAFPRQEVVPSPSKQAHCQRRISQVVFRGSTKPRADRGSGAGLGVRCKPRSCCEPGWTRSLRRQHRVSSPISSSWPLLLRTPAATPALWLADGRECRAAVPTDPSDPAPEDPPLPWNCIRLRLGRRRERWG